MLFGAGAGYAKKEETGSVYHLLGRDVKYDNNGDNDDTVWVVVYERILRWSCKFSA